MGKYPVDSAHVEDYSAPKWWNFVADIGRSLRRGAPYLRRTFVIVQAKQDGALLRALRLLVEGRNQTAMAGNALQAFESFQRVATRQDVSEAGNVVRFLLASKTSDAASVRAALERLSVSGLLQSAAFVAKTEAKVLRGLPLPDLLELLPTDACWAAVLKGDYGLSNRLHALARQEPERVYVTPAAEWLVRHGILRGLTGILELALHNHRRRLDLAPPSDLLRTALRRDKKTAATAILAKAVAADARERSLLCRSVIEAQVPLRGLCDLLATRISTAGDEDPVVALVGGVLTTLLDEPDLRTPFASAFILRVASLLPIAEQTAAARSIAGSLELLAAQWQATTKATPDMGSLWVPTPLSRHSPRPNADEVSRLGARHLAGAWELLMGGAPPTNVVSALGLNLGMEEIGAPGQDAKFDPLRHEDIVGGLNRGADCTVTTIGWTFHGEILLRARVRPLDAR